MLKFYNVSSLSCLYWSGKIQCIPTLGMGGTVSSNQLCLHGNFSVLKLSRPFAAYIICCYKCNLYLNPKTGIVCLLFPFVISVSDIIRKHWRGEKVTPIIFETIRAGVSNFIENIYHFFNNICLLEKNCLLEYT